MIIKLETDEEDFYSFELSTFIQKTINDNNKDDINFIRQFWDNENWESIVRKYNTEGSVYYVWWMEGVRAYARYFYIQDNEIDSFEFEFNK